MQSKACRCQATNLTCISGFPSENCCNRGPTWTPPHGGRPRSPTDLRLMTNVNRNIEEAHESALILCQSIRPFIFLPDAPEFSPSVPTGKEEWPALPACAKIAHAAQALTETADPDTATPAAIGIGKKIKPRTTNGRSNCTTQTTRKH